MPLILSALRNAQITSANPSHTNTVKEISLTGEIGTEEEFKESIRIIVQDMLDDPVTTQSIEENELIVEIKIEDGYVFIEKRRKWQRNYKHQLRVTQGKSINSILLDPKFWQALGREEGWCTKIGNKTEHYFGCRNKYRKCSTKEMHNFIDHLIEGKPINEFFDELLVNKE